MKNEENNNQDSDKIKLSLGQDDLDKQIDESIKEDEINKQIVEVNKENGIEEYIADKKEKKIKKDKPKTSFRFLLLFFVILGLFTVLVFAIGQEPTWTVQYLYYKYYWFYNGFIALVITIFLLIGIRKFGVVKSIFILPILFMIFLLFIIPLVYFTTDWEKILKNPIDFLINYRFDFAFLNAFPVVICILLAYIILEIIATLRWAKQKAILKIVLFYLPVFIIIGGLIYLFINPPWKDVETSPQAGTIGLKNDIDYILLNQKKYNFEYKDQADQLDLEKKLNELKGKAAEESFEKFIIDLRKLNTSYIDQNNNIYYLGKVYPFTLYSFDDGYYVIATTKSYENIYGKKLISINNKKVEDIQKLFQDISSFASQTELKTLYASYLSDYTILNGLSVIDSEESKFTFLDKTRELNVNIKAVDAKDMPKQQGYSEYNKNSLFPYKQNKLLLEKNNDELFYVYQNYNSSVNFNTVKVLDNLNSKTIRTFFVDLRDSKEGNSRYFTSLANAIKYRNIKLDNIVCATNRNTILSGTIAADDCKELMGATIIGEDTGGSLANASNNKTFITPNNKIVFSIVTKLNKKRGKNPVAADRIISDVSSDYFQFKDPVYEYVKTLK